MSSIQEAVALTATNAAFDSADQNTINNLKTLVGLSQTARVMWVKPSQMAVDTSTLTAQSTVDVIAELVQKDILALFRKDHAVTHALGPQYRGGAPPEDILTDATAHTVTTIAFERQRGVKIHIALKPPPQASAAAQGGAEFR